MIRFIHIISNYYNRNYLQKPENVVNIDANNWLHRIEIDVTAEKVSRLAQQVTS